MAVANPRRPPETGLGDRHAARSVAVAVAGHHGRSGTRACRPYHFMNAGDPQPRHIDRAWPSTVHAFQGRTVDNVIAAIEANHPNLTNQKMLYVEISRARGPRSRAVAAWTDNGAGGLRRLGCGLATAPGTPYRWCA